VAYLLAGLDLLRPQVGKLDLDGIASAFLLLADARSPEPELIERLLRVGGAGGSRQPGRHPARKTDPAGCLRLSAAASLVGLGGVTGTQQRSG
jgi:hypothetical protein